MSTLVTVKTEIKNFGVFKSTAEKQGYFCTAEKVFSKGGVSFTLVSNKGTFDVKIDNMHQHYFDKILHEYAKEMLVSELRKRGFSVEIKGTDSEGNILVKTTIA